MADQFAATHRARKIIHVDMDAFYASVEQRDNPQLRGKPIVVGGSPEGRGVVASASYEARKFGVKSAMSCSKAKRICPQAVFVYPRFDAYYEASQKIRSIFLSITPLVEPLSLDEAYLDVTENSMNEPIAREIARHIQARIFEETGLTASAGVGPNKFIAKIASDYRKPRGLVVVPPEKVLSFIENLPIEKLWGVGPATAQRLHLLGLRTISELKSFGRAALERELGKFGAFLYELSCGVDHREVDPGGDPKSRGSETTFSKDVLDFTELKETMSDLIDECSEWLVEEEIFARTVTLKVRYHDFRTITRSLTLPFPNHRAAVFLHHATELLAYGTDAGRVPIRLIGVSLSGFLHRDEPHQLWFDFR